MASRTSTLVHLESSPDPSLHLVDILGSSPKPSLHTNKIVTYLVLYPNQAFTLWHTWFFTRTKPSHTRHTNWPNLHTITYGLIDRPNLPYYNETLDLHFPSLVTRWNYVCVFFFLGWSTLNDEHVHGIYRLHPWRPSKASWNMPKNIPKHKEYAKEYSIA